MLPRNLFKRARNKILRNIASPLYEATVAKEEMAPHVENYKRVSKIGEDSDNPWIKKSAKIGGWLFAGEHELLWKLATRAKEGHILEVGSWMGKSTAILAGACIEVAPNTKVICIDPFDMAGTDWQVRYHKALLGKVESTFEAFRRNAKEQGFADYVVPVTATSQKALPVFSADLRMIFLDGSHDYEHVECEVRYLLPMLRVGGILALHDTSGDWVDLKRYVDEVLSTHPQLKLVDFQGTISAYEKLS